MHIKKDRQSEVLGRVFPYDRKKLLLVNEFAVENVPDFTDLV